MSARTESRPASGSSFSPMARRCASPRVRELRSMADTAYVPRLRAEYDKKIRGAMTEKFGYENVMQVPRLDKVVLNMGVGESVNDRKKAETAAQKTTQIAGTNAM